MAKVTWDGSTLLSPVPVVLVGCGSAEHPNTMTAAWTGVVCSDPPMAYVSIRKERYSYGLIRESGLFSLNLVNRSLVRAADFCGVRAGRQLDKLAHLGLHASAGRLGCPLIDESPLSLECRVTQVLELGSHDLFLAEIEAVHAEESLLDSSGRLCLEKAELVAYSHGQYVPLGRSLGGFGFSVRKKPVRKKPSSSKKS